MDVTDGRLEERKSGQSRLESRRSERAARTKAIVALLAHELRQPLAAILSNAQAALQVLGRDNPDLGEIRQILDDIVLDDQQASAIFGALSERLRRNEVRREEISLAKTIRETLALLQTEFAEAGVEPSFCCETDSVILADEAQIQIVLTNLLANAVEAMQSQPADQRRLEVTLSLAETGMAQVTVSDTGPGIRDTQSRHLFDPFWTAEGRATGIGLSICRSIVQAHGGSIWHRANEHGSATFYFTVPLETVADPVGPASAETDCSIPTTTRILIVDDSQPSRRATWSLLSSLPQAELAGEAADGFEAVQKSEELKPDLILLDVSLSGINGIEAASRIRRVSPGSKMLFLSQYDDPDVVRAVLHTGAAGYVLKVDSGRDLLAAVSAVLRGERFLSSSIRGSCRTGGAAG